MEKCNQDKRLTSWRGKQVVVAMTDGRRLHGKLTGHDSFTICLEVDAAGEVLIFKHAVKYVYEWTDQTNERTSE